MKGCVDYKLDVQDESANELWRLVEAFLSTKGFEFTKHSRCFTANKFVMCRDNVEVHGIVGADYGLKLMVVAPVVKAEKPHDFYYDQALGFYSYTRSSARSLNDVERVMNEALLLAYTAEDIIGENKGCLRPHGADVFVVAAATPPSPKKKLVDGEADPESIRVVFRDWFMLGNIGCGLCALAERAMGQSPEKFVNLVDKIDYFHDLVVRIMADPSKVALAERLIVPGAIILTGTIPWGIIVGTVAAVLKTIEDRRKKTGGGGGGS